MFVHSVPYEIVIPGILYLLKLFQRFISVLNVSYSGLDVLMELLKKIEISSSILGSMKNAKLINDEEHHLITKAPISVRLEVLLNIVIQRYIYLNPKYRKRLYESMLKDVTHREIYEKWIFKSKLYMDTFNLKFEELGHNRFCLRKRNVGGFMCQPF